MRTATTTLEKRTKICKRGFGRIEPHNDDRFQKELASMVRAGHSYTISKILSLSREDIEDQ